MAEDGPTDFHRELTAVQTRRGRRLRHIYTALSVVAASWQALVAADALPDAVPTTHSLLWGVMAGGALLLLWRHPWVVLGYSVASVFVAGYHLVSDRIVDALAAAPVLLLLGLVYDLRLRLEILGTSMASNAGRDQAPEPEPEAWDFPDDVPFEAAMELTRQHTARRAERLSRVLGVIALVLWLPVAVLWIAGAVRIPAVGAGLHLPVALGLISVLHLVLLTASRAAGVTLVIAYCALILATATEGTSLLLLHWCVLLGVVLAATSWIRRPAEQSATGPRTG